MTKPKKILIITALLLVISIACGVTFDTGGEKPDAQAEVEQTLQAVYAQYTLEAMNAANANPPVVVEQVR